jgi:hypothetical protein
MGRVSWSPTHFIVASNAYYSAGEHYTVDGGAGQIGFDTSTGPTAGDISFTTSPSGTANAGQPLTECARLQQSSGYFQAKCGLQIGPSSTTPAWPRTCSAAAEGAHILVAGDADGGTATKECLCGSDSTGAFAWCSLSYQHLATVVCDGGTATTCP